VKLDDLKAGLRLIAEERGVCSHCGRNAIDGNIVVCDGETLSDGDHVYWCSWAPRSAKARARVLLELLEQEGIEA
jgi:hypothetical protein